MSAVVFLCTLLMCIVHRWICTVYAGLVELLAGHFRKACFKFVINFLHCHNAFVFYINVGHYSQLYGTLMKKVYLSQLSIGTLGFKCQRPLNRF